MNIGMAVTAATCCYYLPLLPAAYCHFLLSPLLLAIAVASCCYRSN